MAAHNRLGETERRIHDAALGLFATKGFAATGIREVADQAGITSASLYHYMGTKEGLLVRLLTVGHRRILAVAETQLEGVADPVDQLSRLVHVHVLAHIIRQTETAVMDSEVRSLAPELAAPVIDLRDRYEALWATTLAAGLEQGCFDIDEPSLTRLALLSMCTGVTDWYTKGGPASMTAIAACFADLALGSVRAHRNGEPIRLSSRLIPDAAEIAMQLTEF